MDDYLIERSLVIHRPLEETFAFFENAENLEKITPENLNFEILSPLPIEMKSGALIDYKLRLFGVPFQWQTRIEEYDPPHKFVDTQVSGPYAKWHHTHLFYEVPEGTLCIDRVLYLPPLGPLGTLANAIFVRSTVDDIFNYRTKRLLELLGPATEASERDAA